MRKTRPAFAIVLLVVVQLFCVLPGQGQPTVAPGITSSPPEVTVTISVVEVLLSLQKLEVIRRTRLNLRVHQVDRAHTVARRGDRHSW